MLKNTAFFTRYRLSVIIMYRYKIRIIFIIWVKSSNETHSLFCKQQTD